MIKVIQLILGLWLGMAMAMPAQAVTDTLPRPADYNRISKGTSLESRQHIKAGRHSTPNSVNRRWGRLLAEMGIILAVTETWYWANWKENATDWEYDLPFRDQGHRPFHNKLTDGWVFDTNTFWVNFFGHPYGGTFCYQLGRSKGFNPAESLLLGFAGSVYWEYFGELQERVSFNDVIITSLGGALLGEALHKTSLLLERRMKKGFWRGTITFILDPFRKLNELLDPNAP